MEKKYPLYGLDVSETTSPLEAGLGWAVDLDAEPFIGRDTLRRQRDEGIERLLTGIQLPDPSHVPAAGDAVTDPDGRALGELTSTDRGWFLGVALAMGYLPADLAPGSSVTVTSSDGTAATGTTTHRPFYDPEGIRVRS
jgi:aminomethyltransferase